jgi:hypothetical protein
VYVQPEKQIHKIRHKAWSIGNTNEFLTVFNAWFCFGELTGLISFNVLSFRLSDGATCETRLIWQMKVFTNQHETR